MKALTMSQNFADYSDSLRKSWERTRLQLGVVFLGEPAFGQPLEDCRWILRQELEELLRRIADAPKVNDKPPHWYLDAAPVHRSLSVLKGVVDTASLERIKSDRGYYSVEVDLIEGLICNLINSDDERFLTFSDMARHFKDSGGRGKSDQAFRNFIETDLRLVPTARSPKSYKLSEIRGPLFDKWGLKYQP